MASFTSRNQKYLDEVAEELMHIQHGPEAALKYLASKLGVKSEVDLTASMGGLSIKTPAKGPKSDPNEVVLVQDFLYSEMPKCVSPENNPKRKANQAHDLRGLHFAGWEKGPKWTLPMKAKEMYIDCYDADDIKAHYKDGVKIENASGFEDWYMSQKIDGMRGLWDGKRMMTRQGEILKLPKSFTAKFPKDIALDGELKLLDADMSYPGIPMPESNGFFNRGLSKNHKSYDEKDERWKQARYFIFDIPSSTCDFSKNILKLIEVAKASESIEYLKQMKVGDKNIIDTMDQVITAGGEGLVLREDVPYDHTNAARTRRSKNVYKVKPKYESEGTIVKLLATPTGKPSYRINNISGDLFDGCPVENELRVSHGVPAELKVGDRFTFTYFNVTDKFKTQGGPPVFIKLRNEAD